MAKQTEKILVADDDPDVIDLIAQQVLVPQGYPVATAKDGPSALQMALKVQPDIIITAVELPGLSGRDLMTALQSQGFHSIVIATGPKGSEQHMLQAFRLGAKDYLTKPIREAELVTTIDRALEELRLRREREQLAGKLSLANQQLERRIKELTTLFGIGKAVTAITDLNQLFLRLMDGALYVTEAEIGWLSQVEDGGGKLILRASKNLPPLAGVKLNQPWDDGLSSLLLLSGEGITIGGEPLAKMRAGQIVKAAAAMPIKVKDQTLGVMVVGNKTGRPFTERDQAMLSAVADYASIALVNVRLFQELEERARTFQKSYEQLSKGSQQKDDRMLRIGRDMRTPLMQLRQAIEETANPGTGALNPRKSEALRTAFDRLEALMRLADNMAILSEPSTRPPNPRPIDLAEAAKQSIARLSVEAQRAHISLVTDLPAFTLKAAADATQLGRVLDNLIDNAIRFSPQGAQVTVRVRDGGDGSVQVAVVDKGIGIAADRLPLVWDKFYQVDPTRKSAGPGLGLAAVKQVVEAHGGKVWAESEPGQGSTFYFSLVKL